MPPPSSISTLFPYTTLFRSLSLRPDDLLTILKMVLSIGFGNSISLLPAIQATRRREIEFPKPIDRSEEHTSELQSRFDLVCRLLLEKKKKYVISHPIDTLRC